MKTFNTTVLRLLSYDPSPVSYDPRPTTHLLSAKSRRANNFGERLKNGVKPPTGSAAPHTAGKPEPRAGCFGTRPTLSSIIMIEVL